MNGNQSKATLEHQHTINGLTLVESWLVEDKVHDKSVKYGLNLPIGTWMGAVKVNNEEIWNNFVKTGKVKGFSIEGYFADKMERPKEAINDLEMEAEEQLSTIRTIIKDAERLELSLVDDVNSLYDQGFALYDVQSELLKAQDKVKKSKTFFEQSQKKAADAIVKAKELGASDFIKLFNKKEEEAKSANRIADALITAIDKAITIL